MTEPSSLPFGHLQLSKRAYNICVGHDLTSVGDITEALSKGTISVESAGKKTFEEIQDSIALFERLLGDDGEFDWTRFWDRNEVSPSATYLTSSQLQALSPEVRERPLGRLHLGKARSKLQSAGIGSVGALVDAASAGIGQLKGFGASSRAEMVEALKALSAASQEDGDVDWLDYARARKFKIIPERGDEVVAESFFTEVFPRVCENVVRSQIDDRAWLIFQKRLLVSKDESENLQTIGDVFGVTRERIRQLEANSLDALRRPLLEDDYGGLSFVFRPELTDRFRAARDHFEAVALPAWTKSRWLDELSEAWNMPRNVLATRYRLYAEILGFRTTQPACRDLEAIVVDQNLKPAEERRLCAAVTIIHQLLADGRIADSFDLAKAIGSGNKVSASIDEIPSLVGLCSTAEAIDEHFYRLKFENLQGRSDQVYRLLSERGEPTDGRAILREVNSRLPPHRRLQSRNNLINQLIPDDRLCPIGRSGQWALKSWGLETRSLADLIEEAITDEGEAMLLEDITTAVLEKRPGSQASINIILSTNPERFRRVAYKTYALAAWGDYIEGGNKLGREEIGNFVKIFFKSLGTARVNFSELCTALCQETGLEVRSARGILAHHPAVNIDRPDSHTRLASYAPDWASNPLGGSRQSKPLQVDLIIEAVLMKLRATPTGERPLIDVVKEVELEMKVIRPNIYAAIDQSDEIEKIAVDGSVFKICRLVGEFSPDFPELKRLANPHWRKECERAIQFLDEANVDIGLFVIGRQFDQAMSQLLEEARDRGGLEVKDGHLKSLQNRIDWAHKNQIFTDKATLNLLKVERNERGHQPPTAEERNAIMKFAPFLAALYIDYLVMIDERMKAFAGNS